MTSSQFIEVSARLERSGLMWHPEIGDEVVERSEQNKISVLVDPNGLTPRELRESFLWLPTIEQLVVEVESRNGLVFHAGLNSSSDYTVVVRMHFGIVEASGRDIRTAFGNVLQEILAQGPVKCIH